MTIQLLASRSSGRARRTETRVVARAGEYLACPSLSEVHGRGLHMRDALEGWLWYVCWRCLLQQAEAKCPLLDCARLKPQLPSFDGDQV